MLRLGALSLLLLLAGCATAAAPGQWARNGEGWCYQTATGCDAKGPAPVASRERMSGQPILPDIPWNAWPHTRIR